MALMQITIIPLGTATTSVADYVADAQRFLEEKGVEYALHDMGTIVYGEASSLLSLAAEIHQLPFNKGAQRVVTHITLDDRKDKERRVGEKRQAVLDLLAKGD